MTLIPDNGDIHSIGAGSFEVFMDASPTLAWIKDHEGLYLYTNRTWRQTSTIGTVEAVGKTDFDLWPHYTALAIRTGDEEVLRTGQALSTRHRIRLTAAQMTVWDSYRFAFAGSSGQQLIGGVAVDITQRMLAEDQLARRNELLETVGTLAHVGGWAVDLPSMAITWSPQINRIHEVDLDAAPDLERAIEFYPPEARPVVAAALQEGADRGTAWDLELPMVTAQGRPIWVRSIGSPVIEGDRVVRIVGAFQDVTERRHAEQERASLEARLQQSQRLESLGQLAGGVAHDFNNLLAAIMNYAALVGTALGKHSGSTEDVASQELLTMADDVRQITAVARKGADLTHQLLMFSRREILHPERVDLNTIVSEMAGILRRSIRSDIELSTQLGSALPAIVVDRGQMEQVVMNLAVNARDAIPGSGTLSVGTARFTVDPEYARTHSITEGDYVSLTVSDTGEGMSADVVARAFEPFFTTKRAGAGSGLGLATVYGIVTRAGGVTQIESVPGVGTVVRVIMPADAGLSVALPLEEGVPGASLGETILLVEDEPTVREPVRRVLVDGGYTVLVAADADEAIRVADEHVGPIQLLLSDLGLPGRSGRELGQDLLRVRPDIRVMFMSGFNHDITMRQAPVDDASPLIEKPFLPSQLLAQVRVVLDQR